MLQDMVLHDLFENSVKALPAFIATRQWCSHHGSLQKG
jgi:hypothetical protein